MPKSIKRNVWRGEDERTKSGISHHSSPHEITRDREIPDARTHKSLRVARYPIECTCNTCWHGCTVMQHESYTSDLLLCIAVRDRTRMLTIARGCETAEDTASIAYCSTRHVLRYKRHYQPVRVSMPAYDRSALLDVDRETHPMP